MLNFREKESLCLRFSKHANYKQSLSKLPHVPNVPSSSTHQSPRSKPNNNQIKALNSTTNHNTPQLKQSLSPFKSQYKKELINKQNYRVEVSEESPLELCQRGGETLQMEVEEAGDGEVITVPSHIYEAWGSPDSGASGVKHYHDNSQHNTDTDNNGRVKIDRVRALQFVEESARVQERIEDSMNIYNLADAKHTHQMIVENEEAVIKAWNSRSSSSPRPNHFSTSDLRFIEDDDENDVNALRKSSEEVERMKARLIHRLSVDDIVLTNMVTETEDDDSCDDEIGKEHEDKNENTEAIVDARSAYGESYGGNELLRQNSIRKKADLQELMNSVNQKNDLELLRLSLEAGRLSASKQIEAMRMSTESYPKME